MHISWGSVNSVISNNQQYPRKGPRHLSVLPGCLIILLLNLTFRTLLGTMDGIGAEVSQKIRLAIKVKLEEIGVRVDEELPDYVMVMVVNKRSKEQMDDDLQLFLGENTSFFTTWLHHVLQKLQEVTVAKAGAKRRQSEDSKKKKKSKQEVDENSLIPKKKIKVEPKDNLEKESLTRRKSTEVKKPEESERESSNQVKSTKEGNLPPKKTPSEEVKDSNNTSKSDKQRKDSISKSSSHKESVDEEHQDHKSKSPSVESQLEDFEDEDFINIRTDGELLDGAEDNVDESSKKSKEKDKNVKLKIDQSKEKKSPSPVQESPPREKTKSKLAEKVDKPVQSSTLKKHTSPKSLKSPQKSSEKLVDARELLNLKKAARQAQHRSKTRSRSKSRSPSPQRRRRDDERDTNYRNYNNDRTNRRRREDEHEIDRRANRDRDTRERNMYSIRSRMEDRLARRTDSKRDRRIESIVNEPPALKRTFNQRLDSRKFARSSKDDYDDCEEPTVKRGGLVSRVVPREPSPEAELDTPMPSVVKVTPRPRRPPSQQPSSNLIMKAISDANKSLANVPPRPDSTQQQLRKEAVLTRQKRHRGRVPPEKISVSISNPLAVYIDQQNSGHNEDEGPPSPKYDPSAVNRSPPPELLQSSSQSAKEIDEDENSDKEEWETEEKIEDEDEPEVEDIAEMEKVEEYVPESKPRKTSPKPAENMEEPMEESDPQFVVTLNGYDPDGLFSQCEDEDGEEGDSWFKRGEEPLLTSTQEEALSPSEQLSNPLAMITAAAANHSNLIEVEVMKKSIERCKYWPACRLGDKCTFYHPSKPCNAFPNCKFGDSCLFIHPQCKFNALCTRKDCIFAHTAAPSALQTAALSKSVYTSSTLLPCKFYPNCTNVNCPFTHPSRVCKFGLYCTKKGCAFDHGKVAPVDKLKWTRVSTT